MQPNLILQFNLRDTLQGLAQNLRFEFQLLRIRNVLVMATAAALKVRTARIDAIGRSLDQTRDISSRETGLLLLDLCLDSLSR